MSPDQFYESLLSVSRSGDLYGARNLPGAGSRSQVIQHTIGLRERLDRVAQLPKFEQVAFIKTLALYEDTIGGLGSATILQRLLPNVFDAHTADTDADHELFDWVLNNTKSYHHFTRGVKSLKELQAKSARYAALRSENVRKELERKQAGKARRAAKATGNLYKAIHRGDIAAVRSLLSQGPATTGGTPEGVPLARYAEDIGQPEIAKLIREHESSGQQS